MNTPRISRRAAIAGAAGVSATAALAGCGKGGSGGDGKQQPVRIHANDSSTYEQNFNPYSLGALAGSTGLIFEPLILTSSMDAENPTPWVAKEITFNEDGTQADVTIRDGVTFHDEKPLTIDDVVFSLLLVRDVPLANASKIPITDVAKKDETTATVSFSEAAFPYKPSLGNCYVLPKHLYEKTDFTKDPIKEPIGSGPYKFDKFSKQLYTFVKNEKHWAAKDFAAEQLNWPAFSTETFTTALSQGKIDWSGGFVANVDKVFVSKDPEHRGHWYPGVGLVNLTPNLEHPLWQDEKLRKGISFGVDRAKILKVSYNNYFAAVHPTGLPRPTFEEYIADKYKDLEFEFSPEKGNQALDEAGYPKGSDGVRTAPDGTRLEFDLQIPSAYVDWVSATQILSEGLQEIGIKITPQGVSEETYVQGRAAGQFDITLSIVSAGISPWFMYRSMLSSQHKPKNPEDPVAGNFQRWYDPETDELLAKYQETEDPAKQQEALDGIETIMVEKMPTIPIFVAPNWFNFNTVNWTGFPNEKHPYALGAPYSPIDRVLVARNLKPTNG